MTTLVILAVIVVGVIAFAQLIRVYELSEELRHAEAWKVSDRTNRINSALVFLMVLVFFAVFIYQFMEYGKLLLPKAASEHGPEIDRLFAVTALIIVVVLFSTHALLGWFSLRYFMRKGRKALFHTHNNKLEIVWTAVPTVVLTGLVIYGVMVWSKTINPDYSKKPFVVEVYGKQFQWLFRYPGKDGKLGSTLYKRIAGMNVLGLDSADANGWDDIITSELYLPKGKPVLLLCRAQDVIHSAYLPHFRVQMNCVPGMTTQFQFTPTMTTEEMRAEIADSTFEYAVICNKICGAAHYTMRAHAAVETPEKFEEWLGKQNVFYADMIPGALPAKADTVVSPAGTL